MTVLVVLFSMLAVGAATALVWFSRPPAPRDAPPVRPLLADMGTPRRGSSELLLPRQPPPAQQPREANPAATVLTLSAEDLEELLPEADAGATIPAAPRLAALQQRTPPMLAPQRPHVLVTPWHNRRHNRRVLGAVAGALALAFLLGLALGALLPSH
jgi:hypothetical protein